MAKPPTKKARTSSSTHIELDRFVPLSLPKYSLSVSSNLDFPSSPSPSPKKSSKSAKSNAATVSGSSKSKRPLSPSPSPTPPPELTFLEQIEFRKAETEKILEEYKKDKSRARREARKQLEKQTGEPAIDSDSDGTDGDSDLEAWRLENEKDSNRLSPMSDEDQRTSSFLLLGVVAGGKHAC